MYAFDYRRPATLSDAKGLLSEGAKLLAGGQTLIPTLKQRLANPAVVIDLSAIGELRGIEQSGGALSIGAMTRHAEIGESGTVRGVLPGLATLAEGIGDPHVRNCGTIGGSVANNDPAADYPAALLALGATVVTTARQIPADDFFQGLFTTALGEDEIITRITFPLGARFGYAKMANPASRYALVGVAVSQRGSDVRVAVTGAGASGVFRASALESALTKSFAPAAVDGVRMDASSLMSDMHADADYRAHLIGVMAKRAVAAAA